MSTPNEIKTPPTQTQKADMSSVTFFGNRVLDGLASHLRGVDFAEFIVDQKNAEMAKQEQGNVNTQPEVKVGA